MTRGLEENNPGIEGHPENEELLKKFVAERLVQPVSAVHVENQVTVINENVSFSNINLKLGSDTEYGCQVALSHLRKSPDRLVYVREDHTRSAILTTNAGIIWHGQEFKYLDAKGTGLLSHIHRDIESRNDPYYLLTMKPTANKVVRAEEESGSDTTTWGGASTEWIEKDMELSEALFNLGIRTIPLVAAIDVKQILNDEGNVLSVEEAKRQGLVAEQDEPALLLRAWITPFRMKDVMFDPDEKDNYGIETSYKDIERKRNILLQAIEDIKTDNSTPQEIRETFKDPTEYLKWLATTIGTQVGIMHANGYSHNYLRSLHNITLDARILDLDSMTKVEDKDSQEITNEKEDLFPEKAGYQGTFYKFFYGAANLLGLSINPSSLEKIVKDSYRKTIRQLIVK